MVGRLFGWPVSPRQEGIRSVGRKHSAIPAKPVGCSACYAAYRDARTRSMAHTLTSDLTHATVRTLSRTGAGKLFSRIRAQRLVFERPVIALTPGRRRNVTSPGFLGAEPSREELGRGRWERLSKFLLRSGQHPGPAGINRNGVHTNAYATLPVGITGIWTNMEDVMMRQRREVLGGAQGWRIALVGGGIDREVAFLLPLGHDLSYNL